MAQPNKQVIVAKKEGKWQKIGDLVKKGQRSDITAVTDVMLGGASMQEVASEFHTQYVQYNRRLKTWRRSMQIDRVRVFKTKITIFIGEIGESGTRKSRCAAEIAKNCTSSFYKPRGPWWDGYEGQQVVIIGDFYGGIPYDEILKVWPLSIQSVC